MLSINSIFLKVCLYLNEIVITYQQVMYAPVLVLLLLSQPSQQPVASRTITLQEAILFAMEHANEMIQAKEDLVLIDADYMTALSAIFPQISLQIRGGDLYTSDRIIEFRGAAAAQPNSTPIIQFGGPWQESIPSSFNNVQFSFGLSARQLIFDGGRWWMALKQVGDFRRSSESNQQAVTNLVSAAVARAFYGLEQARLRRRTIETQVALDHEQVERAEALVAVGRSTRVDVAIAKRNLATDQLALVNAETTEGQAHRTFNLQIGQSSEIIYALQIPPRVFSLKGTERIIPTLDRLRALTAAYRPELAGEGARIAGLEKGVVMERSAYLPTVTAGARYNRSSRFFERAFGSPFENFEAGVDVNLEWRFQGMAPRAVVDRARVQLRKARANYDALQRTVYAEVEDSFQRYSNLQRIRLFAAEQVIAAEEAVDLARGLYEVGRSTSLQLRDSELGLTQARIALIDAQLSTEVAYMDLVQAVGTDKWEKLR